MCKILIVIMAVFSTTANAGSFSMEDYLKSKQEKGETVNIEKKAEPVVVDFVAAIVKNMKLIDAYKEKIKQANADIETAQEPLLKSGGLNDKIISLKKSRDKYKEEENFYNKKMQSSSSFDYSGKWKGYCKKRKQKESEIAAVKAEIAKIKKQVTRLNSGIRSYNKKIKSMQAKLIVYKRKLDKKESEEK